MQTSERISGKIIKEVAASQGVDPLDLDDRLYDVIDPDALNALFEGANQDSKRTTIKIEFQYCGCEIAVDATGEVTLHHRDEA